jgi:hypothetical protein
MIYLKTNDVPTNAIYFYPGVDRNNLLGSVKSILTKYNHTNVSVLVDQYNDQILFSDGNGIIHIFEPNTYLVVDNQYVVVMDEDLFNHRYSIVLKNSTERTQPKYRITNDNYYELLDHNWLARTNDGIGHPAKLVVGRIVLDGKDYVSLVLISIDSTQLYHMLDTKTDIIEFDGSDLTILDNSNHGSKSISIAKVNKVRK